MTDRELLELAAKAAGMQQHLRCQGQAVVRRKGALYPCGCEVR